MEQRDILKYENEWPWGKSVTLCYSDGKGMVTITFETKLDFGFIKDLKVHPTVQEQGRGNELLSLAEKIVSEAGLNHTVLRVVPNSWQLEWYKRHGYNEWKDSYFSLTKYIDLHKYI